MVRDDWSVADVALAQRRVTVHRPLAARTPSAAAKGVSGPVVSAALVSPGRLALAGGSVNRRNGRFAARGAFLVDTATWRAHRLDRTSGAVAAGPGLLLAFDGPWDQVSNQSAGRGVAAYTGAGRLRYRALRGARIAAVQVGGAYAYAVDGIGDGQAFRIGDGRQTAYDIAGGLMVSLMTGPRGP